LEIILKGLLLNKYLISPLLLTILLQACGGSSSDAPEVPVEPVEYSFSLTSQLTNVCDVSTAFTEVELLLQDETWQTLDVYQPDENGVISFVTTSEFINYTLVAKDQKGSEAEGLNVVSYYQASSATPAHYQAQFDELMDNTSCECVTNNIKLSHRTFGEQTSVVSSVGDVIWNVIDNKTTLVEGVEVCRVADGQWPQHSFSVLGVNSNQEAIGAAGFEGDYIEDVDGIWTLAVDEFGYSVELATPHQGLITSQLINNAEHFILDVVKEDESFLYFPEHAFDTENFYQSKASVTFVPSDSIFRSSVINTHHQIVSTVAQDSFAVKANEQQPAFNAPYFDEINADGSYDYSAVSGYPMAVINFTYTAYDPITKLLMPAQWTFYGPDKGLLAISAPLTGYEDIINIDTHIETTNIRLIKSVITNNYNDYIKHYQGKNTFDMTNDFVKDIREAELNLKF